MNVDSVIEQIRAGKHPAAVVEAAAGPELPDRHDIGSEAEWMAGYHAIVKDVASYGGEITIDWPVQVANELVGADAEKRADLARMAQDNRDAYTRNGATDKGGNAPMWSDILRGILALPTDKVAPSQPPAH